MDFIKKKDYRFWILILFVFTLPNSIAINNIASAIVIIYWLIWGDKKETLNLIKFNPIVSIAFLFFLIHIIALIWTEDLQWGVHIVGKEIKFLMLPILMSLIKKEEVPFLINTFIVSMTLTEIISYLIWFEILPPMFGANSYDPAPFMGHIPYNPFLAFTIYLLLHTLLFQKDVSNIKKIYAFLFTITMSINIFITGGRAGQVAFFVVIVLTVFQFYRKSLIKAISIILILIPIIFTIAYNTSTIFHKRINSAINNIKIIEQNPNTSVGLRIIYNINTLRIIAQHPIIGVGTGDFPKEYKNISDKYSPNVTLADHPHNMYLLVWSQTGLIGIISLLTLLFLQIYIGFKKTSTYYRIQIILPIIFLVIMFSDDYLLGHYTTTLYVLFSSLLFKDVTWKSIKS